MTVPRTIASIVPLAGPVYQFSELAALVSKLFTEFGVHSPTF